MHRTIGGIVAGAFFVIPSIFILLALSYVDAAFGNVPFVAGVLSGFKPIVVAIVVEAVIKIGGKALKRWAHFVLAGLAFVSIYFLHIPFPLIVLAAAIIGLLGVRLMPSVFAAQPKTKETDKKTEGEGLMTDTLPLVIDDNASPPEHTLPNKMRTFKILTFGTVALAFTIFCGWIMAWLGKYPRTGIPILYTSRTCHIWRGLCRLSLRCPSRSDLWMDEFGTGC